MFSRSITLVVLAGWFALACAQGWQPAPGGPAASVPRYMRFKLVQVPDQEGWEQPVEAFRFLVPSDWTVQARVRWSREGVGCPSRLIDAGMWAVAPDGITGIEMMPAESWRWIDDAQLRTASQQQEAQMRQAMGATACPWSPMLSAAEYLQRVILPQRRQGAQLTFVQREPQIARTANEQVASTLAPLVANRLIAGYQVDAARMGLKYRVAGRMADEWITSAITAVINLSPSLNQLMNGTGTPMRSFQVNTQFTIAVRAPEGELERSGPVFEAILSTLKVNLQWAQAVETVRMNLGRIAQKGVMDRAQIWREAGQSIAQTQKESWQRQQRVQDSLATQFSQTVRGVQSYLDPVSGNPVELSGGYARAFANGRGEYILSNDALFDPAVALRENWRPMQPLGRQP